MRAGAGRGGAGGLLRLIRFGAMRPWYLATEALDGLPGGLRDWVEPAVTEALRARAASGGGRTIEARHLGPEGLAGGAAMGVAWDRAPARGAGAPSGP